MKIPSIKSKIVLASVMLLALVGCQHHDWEAFDQHEGEFSARRLYQPLVSGQNDLLSRLPNVLGDSIAFALDNGVNAHRIDDGIEQSEYWDQDKVVFFGISPDSTDEAQEWVWFNPRRLRVEPVVFDDAGNFTMGFLEAMMEDWACDPLK